MSTKIKRSRQDIDAGKLITLVEAREVLWDVRIRGHRSKHLVDENWKEVSEELGAPVSLLRKKFKNLKDQFRKEYKKDFSDWHHYTRMSFLATQFRAKDVDEDADDPINAEASDAEGTVKRRNKKYKKSAEEANNVHVDVNRLIALVHVREPIWDKDDRRHHNPYKLDECWQEVANELGCTMLHARQKWKHLRDTLRRELRKSESSWVHLQKLSFLFPQFSQMSFFPEEGDDDDEGPQQINEEDMNEYYGDDTRNSEDGSYLDMQDHKPVIVEFADPEATGEAEENNPIPTMRGHTMDEDVGFFNSLLPHVKKLSCEKKMSLRMKIQELVYNSVYSN